MRILHVISSVAPRYGGPSKAVIEMCQELIRRNHDVDIFTTNADIEKRLEVPLQRRVDINGVPITYFPVQANNLYKLSLPLASALRRFTRDFDIVHTHSLYQFPATAAAHYCRRYRIPYVVRPHGTLDPFLFGHHRARKWLYEFLWERRNLKAAAAVQFTADQEMTLAQSLQIKFNGVVVPIGVSTPSPSNTSRRLHDFWPETKGKKVILFLGRVNFKKGLDILAEAFGNLARKREDIHLLIAGPDDEGYGDRVKAWLAGFDVLKRTTFTGMLTGEAKATVLSQSALFVLPSYSENFGIAVVEAMAAGLPVVISNRINICREVQQAGAGLVTNPRPLEISDAIELVLDDISASRLMSARGIALAKSFSWRTAGTQLVDMYDAILSKQRQTRSLDALDHELI
jgi:glycosyltransferase involved in cell wall biosynthesis